jgi:hypothetical protein
LVIMRWLDSARHPLLVQLANAEYAPQRTGWELPELACGEAG